MKVFDIYHKDIWLKGEFEAQYFSVLRRNLKSDLAEAVINNSQDLRELEFLKGIKDEKM